MCQFLAVNSRELWPPPGDFEADSESYYRESLAIWVCFYTGLWAVEISFLLFFKRLGQNVVRQQILWCVFVFTVVAYMPDTCLTDSFDKLMRDCSIKSTARHERVVLWVNCILDVVSDYTSMLSELFNYLVDADFSCCNSHGTPSQHAMGSTDVVEEKSGVNWYFFLLRSSRLRLRSLA